MPAAEFPPEDRDKFTPIALDCADLANRVERVAFAAHKDGLARGAFNLVHVQVKGNNYRIEACNGKDLARMESAEPGNENFDIPLPALRHFCAYLRLPGAVLSNSEKRLKIKHDAGEYACIVSENTYPQTDIVAQWKFTQYGEIRRDAWLPVFRTACALSPERADVFLRKNMIECEGSRFGSLSVPAPDKLDGLELHLNGQCV